MNVLQSPERHGHPAFDVRVLKDQGLVSNDSFQIRIQKLEHEVDILLYREDIEQLRLVSV